MTLDTAFLGHCPPTSLETLRDETSLADVLEAIMVQARAAWPRLPLDPDAFIAHVAQRLPESMARVADLEAIHTDDMYLAFGCTVGDARALSAFESAYGSDIERAAQRVMPAADDVRELAQSIRIRLLAPHDDAPARIARYAGHGTLRAWVRTASLRFALNFKRARSRRREVDLADALREQPAASRDPELTYVRGRYREAFRLAFGEAVRALSEDQRRLLRQHYLRGVTLEQMAAIHRVHRVTVARRIARARACIIEGTRERLAARASTSLSRTEYDSIVRAALSRAELSLPHMLAHTAADGESGSDPPPPPDPR